MRKGWLIWTFAFILCGVCAAAQSEAKRSSDGEQYVGIWPGTWDGAGTGDFELTLEKSKDGAVIGRVAVTTDGGNYKAKLKSLSFEDKTLNAMYDFPLDASAEVALAAVIEGGIAKGTWSLRPKGQHTEIAAGTWTVTRK